jgi:Family of unknown function (DUF6516)
MKATLLYQQKETRIGYIREIVVWKLDKALAGCVHAFKYRLFFGRIDGSCLVRYDNERGKGDHRHRGGREEPYRFTGLEVLLTDFATDITAMLAEMEEAP